MNPDPTAFIPSPDDAEFVGRFEHFTLWKVPLLVLATMFVASLISDLFESADPPRDSLAGVIQIIEEAVDSPANERVILIGDSVLRGQVMQSHGVEDWQNWTVAAHMRRLIQPGIDVSIHDLSLDGMLPGDLLALTHLLDERDPDGRVRIAMELSPRYLSVAYAQAEKAFSREYLRTIGESIEDGSGMSQTGLDLDRLALSKHRFGLMDLRGQLPDALRNPATVFSNAETEVSTDSGNQTMEASLIRKELHRGRVLPHFMETDASAGNLQTSYLRLLSKSAESRQRSVLYFVTPINEYYLLPGKDPAPIYNTTGPFRRLLSAGERDAHSIFRNFNDASLGADAFLDHCHLTPDGNRRLAERLCRTLSLPLQAIPSDLNPVGDLGAPLAYVLGTTENLRVRGDGVASQVSLGAYKSVVAVRPGVLYVSDRGNSRLCEVHVPSQTCSTVFDGHDLSGETAYATPRFAPGAMLSDRSGGAFFMDMNTGFLGHLGPAGKVGVVSEERPWKTPKMDVRLAHLGDQVLVYESTRGLFFRVDSATGVVNAFQLSPLVGLRSIVEAPGGTHYVLDESGQLLRIQLKLDSDAPVEVQQVVPLPDAEGIAAYWEQMVKSYGTFPLPGDKLALSDPTQLLCEGDRLWISDHLGDFHFIWQYQISNQKAHAVLAPREDGFMMVGKRARTIGPGSWTAAKDGTLFWLSSQSSLLYRLQAQLLGRPKWGYWPSPTMETSPTTTQHGLTYGVRKKGHYRVGVFGSSLVGANKVEDIPLKIASEEGESGSEIESRKSLEKTVNLLATRGLPMALGTEFRKNLTWHSAQIDVLDYTVKLSTLTEQYVALVAQDPLDLDLAIFSIDRGTTQPHTARDLADPVDQWMRMSRDENGLPQIGWTDGHVPTPIWIAEEEALGTKPSKAGAMLACLEEMFGYCVANGIRTAIVDVSSVDNRYGSGFVRISPKTQSLTRQLQVLAQNNGVPYITPKLDFLGHSGERGAFSAAEDHHLTREGHGDLAALIARRLRGSVERDLFRFEARLLERRAKSKVPRARQMLGKRLGLGHLDATRAVEFGLIEDKVRVLRAGKQLTLMVEMPKQDPKVLWKSALAALGLAGAAEAREGDQVSVHLVRYLNHDEYGGGVKDGMQDLGQFQISADDLPGALASLIETLALEQRPDWFVNP